MCEELGAENIIASDLSEQKFDFPCKYEQLDVVDAERWLPEEEPAVDLLVLLHLELLVVVVDVFRQVPPFGQEGMSSERKRGLVVGHHLFFPFAKALRDPPKWLENVGSIMNHKSGVIFSQKIFLGFPNSYLVHLPVEGREEKKQKKNQLEKHNDKDGVVTSSLWRRMEAEHQDIGEETYYLSSEHGRLT